MLKSILSAFNDNGFVRITKGKALLGIILGAVAFYICAFRCYSLREGVIIALCFVFLGLFRLDLSKIQTQGRQRAITSMIRLLFSLLCVFLVCVYSLDIIDTTISSNLSGRIILLNLLCAFIIFAFFTVITGNAAVSTVITVLVLMGISTVNGFVFLFRGKELSAMDILSVRTAANVAGQYTYSFPPHVTLRWMWTFLLVFASFSLPAPTRAHPIGKRLMCLALCLISTAILIPSSKDIGVRSWDYLGSQLNGFYLNFALGIRDSFRLSPDGYSEDLVEALAEESSASSGQDSRKPNIIVIMNEAFSDLDIFKNPLNPSTEVIPFVSSLSENTVKGSALVSIFGGNTANSEFEFLTSHTMAFFPNPTNSVPYQQYIDEPVYAFPQLMRSMGYETFATHPYLANGWSRNVQYPRLGFDGQTFMDAYPMENLVRGFVSDREMYEYILGKLSETASRPLFLFGVTMQNHSAYETEGFENSIRLEGDYPLTEQYLSSIHESDKAVEYLIGQLEDYPEDTVVLFFGDHMPKIENDFYLVLNGGPLRTLDEQMLKYTVPFFIWANYDIDEYTLEQTSLNYLAGHLLDAAGIELPPYYQFLRDTEEIIPAINAYGYYSRAQGRMIPLSEAQGEEAEAIRRYDCVQYNNMFDSKNRNELFFGQYISAD